MIENVINGNSVYCFEIGDSANVLKRIPDNSIDCIIASPPYWQQRIYEKNGEIISATGVTGKKYLSQIQCSEVLSEEEKQNALSALNETLDEMKRGEVVDFRMTIRGEQRVYHSESKKISGREKELSEKGFFIVKMRKKGFLPSNIWRILTRPFMKMLDERMAAVRECGWDFDLIVENHCRTDAISAVMMGELCDKYQAMAFEEPTIPMNPRMHKAVHEKIKPPHCKLGSIEIYTRGPVI